MEETFKKEDALKEEIAWLEEENKKLLLQLHKVGKLIESIERIVHITKPFGCAVFAGMVAIPIIPEGRFIIFITALLLIVPVSVISYMFR
jgi:hypothetical protein